MVGNNGPTSEERMPTLTSKGLGTQEALKKEELGYLRPKE